MIVLESLQESGGLGLITNGRYTRVKKFVLILYVEALKGPCSKRMSKGFYVAK